MSTTDTFEDRLLVQLRHVVAGRPAPATSPAPTRPRRMRIAGLVASGAACAAALALLATGGGGADPAYALARQHDGTVAVTISSLRDADGLQARLRAAGIPAVVDYHPSTASDACTGPGPGSGPARGLSVRVHKQRDGTPPTGGPGLRELHTSAPGGGDPPKTTVRLDADGSATFSIDPAEVPAGAKVFITTSDGALSTINMAIGDTAPSTTCPG